MTDAGSNTIDITPLVAHRLTPQTAQDMAARSAQAVALRRIWLDGVRNGTVSIFDLFQEALRDPDGVGKIRLQRALAALPGVTAKRVRAMLQELGVNETQLLRQVVRQPSRRVYAVLYALGQFKREPRTWRFPYEAVDLRDELAGDAS